MPPVMINAVLGTLACEPPGGAGVPRAWLSKLAAPRVCGADQGPGSYQASQSARPGTGGGAIASSELRALVLRARSGDRAAFAELYERFASTVHGILLGSVAWQDAQDLVHDVFATVLDRIAALEDPERFAGWLASIARNKGRDALRRKRRVDELPEDVAAPGERAGVELEQAERAARLLDAVRELPDAYRETLILRLVEGLTGPEIAERTGLTHGSVRVNLHRGMKLLREALDRGGAA